MRVDWLSWSNPVSVWWGFLLVVSSINVFFWLRLHRYLRRITLRFELLVFLSAAYVFGCAFRAILPRADVQRICLFDTWLSSVFLGRSVATVAEICFVTQWALVLRHLAGTAESITTRNIANAIVPLIVLAESCSWYAVITTSYLGNTLENSLWAVTFLLIAVALLLLPDCPVERRDCMDVALFQRGGMDQFGALRFCLGQGPIVAIPRDGRVEPAPHGAPARRRGDRRGAIERSRPQSNA
jgi:hypothetical protein